MDDFAWISSVCLLGASLALLVMASAPGGIPDQLRALPGLVAFACVAFWIFGLFVQAAWPRRAPDRQQSENDHE